MLAGTQLRNSRNRRSAERASAEVSRWRWTHSLQEPASGDGHGSHSLAGQPFDVVVGKAVWRERRVEDRHGLNRRHVKTRISQKWAKARWQDRKSVV